LEGLTIRDLFKPLKSLVGASSQGSKREARPPSLGGSKLLSPIYVVNKEGFASEGYLFEIIRFKFYQKIYDVFGWLKLPYYHQKFFEGVNLRKSVIKSLEAPFFVGSQKSFEGSPSHGGFASVCVSGGIDLIPVDNSPKNIPTEGEEEKGNRTEEENITDLIKEYLRLKQIPLENRSKEENDRIKVIEEKYPKLQKVYRRLRNLPTCGMKGHLGYKPLEDLEFELSYHPHRCGSNICPVCSFYESQRKFKRVFDLLKLYADLKDTELAFITLTTRPKESPSKAIETILGYRNRLHNLNLSKKVLEKVRKYLFKEVISFYHYLKRKKGEKEARKRVKVEINRIREFLKELNTKIEEFKEENPNRKKVRISDIYPSIVKLEVHKTPEGWYAHLHIINKGFIPKTLLTSFWRFITNNESYITDIRKLKGKKAIAEISKYETKPVNDKLTDFSRLWTEKRVYQKWKGMDIEITLEELFEMEYALFGRKKLIVWGKWKEQTKEEEEEKIIPLWCVNVYTKRTLFKLPKLIRKARKEGREIFLTECEIVFSPVLEIEANAQLEFKGKIFVNNEGKLRVNCYFKDKGEEEWFNELLDRAIMYVQERIERKKLREEVRKRKEQEMLESEGLPKHLREKVDLNLGLDFL